VGDVLAVVTDLFVQSRIAAAAKAAGRQVRFVGSESQIQDLAPYAVALVDLDARTDVLGVIRRLKLEASMPVVAFGPHLDTERRKRARAAGADRVLAKSKFVTELPKIMEERQTGEGQGALDGALAEMREYATRMEELARLLRDPESVGRIYFAPDPHMETAEAHGDPIVLNAADFLGFLAVDSFRAKLQRIRKLRSGVEEAATSPRIE
jgi:CheY-like chemotaxis protein